MKTTLLLVLSFLLPTSLFATHVSGGEIRYEYNGNNYTVFVTMYQMCGPGTTVPLPNAADVRFQSSVAPSSFIRSLPKISQQALTNNCSPFPTSCTSPTSSLPGFNVAVYSDTVSLAAASNWVISYLVGARSNVNNLSGTGNMYIEATLNNSTSHNTNALVPNATSNYLYANSPMTIPLQTVDADGDSIAYEQVIPQVAAGVNATFNAGFPPFSATNPFGASGVYTINATNQTMTLNSQMVGPFQLAYRVKEYRNGTLIATHTRDFTVPVLQAIAPVSVTYPMPASLASLITSTCPGQANNVSITFNDATATDSVILSVTTPTISGFTFTPSITNGIGSANVTISWTTPAGMNPATLPHFYVNIRARDNACPKAIADYVLLVRTQNCAADSVWPGDANSDKVVNLLDPLYVAIAFGQTGPSRPGASSAWTAQACMPWANSFPLSGVNMKHADCDGNGTVGLADLGSIAANYGMTHPKGSSRAKLTGVPDLFFDFNGVKLVPGASVTVPIKLGDANSTMADFYGLATRIAVGNLTLSGVSAINTNISWVGTSANTISFTKAINANTMDWAHARTDHQNTTGGGVVGSFTFMVPANATPGSTVNFSFSNTTMIDKDGAEITGYNTVDGTAMIAFPGSVDGVSAGLNNVQVIPNPSQGAAVVRLDMAAAQSVEVKVVDMVGKTVWQQSRNLEKGANDIALPATNLSNGIYMIHISTDNWNAPVTRWVKQ